MGVSWNVDTPKSFIWNHLNWIFHGISHNFSEQGITGVRFLRCASTAWDREKSNSLRIIWPHIQTIKKNKYKNIKKAHKKGRQLKNTKKHKQKTNKKQQQQQKQLTLWAKCRPWVIGLFFLFCFLILHECIIVLARSLLLWTFCCSVLTHLALSHHPTPWKVSPCLLSHTSVHVFWFSHGLGTLPESYLKRWDKIQHSHDLKIESANKFQHGLWYFFSNPPIYASGSIFSRI